MGGAERVVVSYSIVYVDVTVDDNQVLWSVVLS